MQVDHNSTITEAMGVLIEQRLGMVVAVEASSRTHGMNQQ